MIKPKTSVQGLQIYQPGKTIEEVQRAYGLKDVMKLAANENPFGCSPKVSAALAQITDFSHQYPEPTAPILKEKLAKQLQIDPQKLIFGNGSSEIIQMICRAFLEAGDESILADMTYSIYKTEMKIEGAVPVFVPLRNGVHDLEAMKNAITDKTKVIWICNPNNPTGTIINQDDLVSFLEQLPKHILVVVDEAYFEYVTDSTFPNTLSLLDDFPQVIILRTFSKIYGLAAFRIGYGISQPSVIGELHRVRPAYNISRPAQQAALAALDDPDFIAHWKEINDRERKRIYANLEKWNLHYFPSQGNFILFDTKFPAIEVFQYLLQRGIIARAQFSYPSYIRISVGTPEQNERFLDAFSDFIHSKK